MKDLFHTSQDWIFEKGWLDATPAQALIILAGLPCVLLVARLLSVWTGRWLMHYRRGRAASKTSVFHFQNSFFFLIAMLMLSVLLASVSLTGQAKQVAGIVLRSGWAATLCWLLYRSLTYATVLVEHRISESTTEAWRIRGVRTQMIILRRIAGFVVLVLAVSIMLLQFEVVQKVGLSLLASAGVAGIVIGLSAQKSIASILYGLQLAITQPVRIGDTVILEGEWGQIEEIHLTYVVLRIWDERRLIVPVERILNAPFENWTRTSPRIIGTVFINVDFRAPVSDLRQAFTTFVQSQPLWDGRVCSLQVTEVQEHSVQLRALVSAADASSVWDLRCLVREWFIEYLSSLDGGRYLPVFPVQASDPDEADGEETGGPDRAP